MKALAFSFAGLILAATSAHAQPADPASETAGPQAPSAADAPADAAAPPAAGAAPSAGGAAASAGASAADGAAPAAEVSDADIDSFAKATVKLQEIQADTAIAADQKQTAMAAAVAEAGLDPAKYNEIGKAAAADAALRVKVQTAMSKYAPQPSEG